MAKIQRVVDNAFLNGGKDAKGIEYNPASGGQKSLTVGPRLLPIPIVTAGTPGLTTDCSGKVILPFLGAILAIYNNAGAAGSVTISPASANSLAIGATDSAGNVGVACPPNAWTYISAGNNQYIVTSAATLIVYIIEDPTKLIQETGAYAQQANNPYAQLPVNS